MLRHFLNPPNWFTSASLFCGLYSILLATGAAGEQNLHRAAILVLFAAVFDTIDGGVARLTGTGSAFGIQLDSLVDAVSFGLAPAVLLYTWGLHPLGIVGLLGAFAFALCGLFRLARFNLAADGTKGLYSEGLTITMAGATVAALVIAHIGSGRDAVEHPANVLAIALVLGVLMVSTVPYRTFRALRVRGPAVVWLALLLGAFLVVAARYRLSTGFTTVLGAYVLSGPAEALVRVRRRVARDGTITTDDDDFEDFDE